MPFVKSNIPWNKGKTDCYSQEYKTKISNTLKRKGIKPPSRKGMVTPLEVKEKLRKASIKNGSKPPVRYGKDNCLWKGGITPLGVLLRTCNKYLKWRTKVFKRDKYTCQECGAKNGNGKSIVLNVHHKIPFSLLLQKFIKCYNTLSPSKNKKELFEIAMKYKDFWDIKNGQTLCKICHKKTF